MSMSNPVLSCDSLRKSFNGVQALDDVTLTFPSEGVVAIVGANGAGKSTLFDVITGWERPHHGEVRLDGQRIDGIVPWRIARMGIARTFQELRIIRGLSALDNILMGLPHGLTNGLIRRILRFGLELETKQRRRAGMDVLEKVGLAEQALELAGRLSYGQQKLLAMARCIASHSRVLLLDEPVAGVHPHIGAAILDLLTALGRDDGLVVFIEHDLSAVRRIADSVVVMDRGRVVASGAPEDTLAEPRVLEAFVD